MRTAMLLLGAAALVGCGEDERTAASTENALIAANAAKDRAMVAGDASALENFYTADYQVIDDDGKVHDKRNQVEFMTRSIDLLEASSADVNVSMLGKNAALVTGRMSGRYRDRQGEKAFTEQYTSVWVTEDSQWRVRHEHSSTVEKPR